MKYTLIDLIMDAITEIVLAHPESSLTHESEGGNEL